MAWEHLRIPQKGLENIAGARDIWTTLSTTGWVTTHKSKIKGALLESGITKIKPDADWFPACSCIHVIIVKKKRSRKATYGQQRSISSSEEATGSYFFHSHVSVVALSFISCWPATSLQRINSLPPPAVLQAVLRPDASCRLAGGQKKKKKRGLSCLPS